MPMAHAVPSRELGGPPGKGCSLRARLRARGAEHGSGGHRSRSPGPVRAVPAAVTRGELSPLAASSPPVRGRRHRRDAGLRVPPTAAPPWPAGHMDFPVLLPGSREGSVLPPSLQRRRQGGKESSSCLKPNIPVIRAAAVGSNTSHFPPPAPGASLGGAAPPRLCLHAHVYH